MKCVRCRKDAGKRDRDSHSGCCPSCGHRFVADPSRDGLTDATIQQAVDTLTAGGSFRFLPRQLVYELRRRRGRKLLKLRGCFVVLAILAAVLGALALLAFATQGAKGLPMLLFFAFPATAAFVLRHRMRGTTPMAGDEELVRRWLDTNPSPQLIDRRQLAERLRGGGSSPDLGEATFDRVLVCDREEWVDFLLANQFHFHYSCPVLGARGYPERAYANLVDRLRRNPRLEVFVLHDLTPHGLAFAAAVRTSPTWFGGHTPKAVVDIGLLAPQLGMFERMLVPLAEIPGAGPGDVPFLPAGQGVEVAVLRPENLVRLLGQSLEHHVPFHLLPQRRDDGSSSSGGYG